MKKPMLVCGTFAALALSSSALGGFVFFTDPGEFQLALEKAGKKSKGFWDPSNSNMPPGFIGGFGDPLNNNNIPFDPEINDFLWAPGSLLDNVTFQSNISPQGAGGPNPRGFNALVAVTAPAFDLDNTAVMANYFADGFDILSGPPAGDNHTAMAIDVVGLLIFGPMIVTVWDKFEEHKTKFSFEGPWANGEKRFLGILSTDGRTIGRVNIYDPGDPNDPKNVGGIEGISFIEVWIPAPGSLALLGLAGLFVRRRRRRR